MAKLLTSEQRLGVIKFAPDLSCNITLIAKHCADLSSWCGLFSSKPVILLWNMKGHLKQSVLLIASRCVVSRKLQHHIVPPLLDLYCKQGRLLCPDLRHCKMWAAVHKNSTVWWWPTTPCNACCGSMKWYTEWHTPGPHLSGVFGMLAFLPRWTQGWSHQWQHRPNCDHSLTAPSPTFCTKTAVDVVTCNNSICGTRLSVSHAAAQATSHVLLPFYVDFFPLCFQTAQYICEFCADCMRQRACTAVFIHILNGEKTEQKWPTPQNTAREAENPKSRRFEGSTRCSTSCSHDALMHGKAVAACCQPHSCIRVVQALAVEE